MTYKDGIVWSGAGDVWKSTDLGLTWKKTSCPSGIVYRIVFFNDSIGVVCIEDDHSGTWPFGLYLTTNQGATWSQPFSDSGTYDAAFGVTPDTIVVAMACGYRITNDGGRTWSYNIGSSFEDGPISSRAGTFYYKDNDHLRLSGDGGRTWSYESGSSDTDCHSWSFDSCDVNTIYLVNEELYYFSDTVAVIYVTRDLGATWHSVNRHRVNARTNTGYYCGNIATSRSAVFAQTQDGVIRSRDNGQTWEKMGGPAGQKDQQLMAVVDDTILLVADEFGNMWRRTDGIGTAYYPTATLLSPSELFSEAALPTCEGPFMRAIAVGHSCRGPYLSSWSVTGVTASLITVVDTAFDPWNSPVDSLFVQFSPPGPGYYVDSVTLFYDDGSSIGVRIQAQVVTPQIPAMVGDGHPFFLGSVLGPCGGSVDSSVLIDYSCRGMRIVSEHITGPDSSNYKIENVTRDSLEYLDSIAVTFRPDTIHDYHASLIVRYSDGTVITVPLAGSETAGPPILRLAPRDSLFATAKISPCDKPVTDTVVLLAVCPKILESISLHGLDSANYTIVWQSHDSIDATDTIVVRFGVSKPGRSVADLVVQYNDTTVHVPIGGTGIPGTAPFAIISDTLFKLARLGYCDAPVDTFVVINEGCHGRAVALLSTGGPDSASYHFCCTGHDSTRLLDTVRLTFRDSVTGPSHGTLNVRYDDGTIVQVPLGGQGIQAPQPRLASNRDSLFTTAQLYPCEKPVADSCFVVINCSRRKLVSLIVSGRDSANYTISRVSNDTSLGVDSVALTFTPDTAGPSQANLEFLYQDGTEVTVALAGTGRAVLPASIALADLYADTMGATVSLPITIRHGPLLSGMSFDLHYDTTLLAFDGLQWAGGAPVSTVTRLSSNALHVSLDLSSQESDSVTLLYVLFDWYPADSGRANVWIDSVVTNSALPGCTIQSNRETRALIHGPIGCTTPFLIEELRYGTMPYFSIRPNPASHTIEITSSGPLDAVRITDALGRSVSADGNLSKIDISQFSPGLYYVQVQQGDRKAGRTLIIER